MTSQQDTIALSISDRWKRYCYLEWLDTYLWRLPRRRRKEIRAELKQNLAVASADTTMVDAIDEHGSPRALARQYLDAEPRQGPIWAHGVVAAVVVIVVWVFATFVYVIGALETLDAVGSQGPATIGFLGVTIEAESSPDFMGATFTGFSWPTLIVAVLALLAFSRVWRIGRARTTV